MAGSISCFSIAVITPRSTKTIFKLHPKDSVSSVELIAYNDNSMIDGAIRSAASEKTFSIMLELSVSCIDSSNDGTFVVVNLYSSMETLISIVIGGSEMTIGTGSD